VARTKSFVTRLDQTIYAGIQHAHARCPAS
jgi:hypothetical protein